MNELDQMLDAPSETALPLLVQYCKTRQAAGDRIEVELHRPDMAGALARTVLVLRRWEKETELEAREVEWDEGVDAGLVDLGIKAIDLQHESERFALGIRAALRKVERRYGDGYLNAVLIDLLDDSELSKTSDIVNVRKYVQVNPPERGRVYQACRELIAHEIGGRAVELRDKLKYKPDEIKAVMARALAIYLDERFSVSSRRYFGLL